MAKKTDTKGETGDEPGAGAAPAGLFDSALAGTVRDSAQQIWLAGLGAFAKAQEEGGRVFEALVRDGTTLQRKTQAVAEEKLGDVASKVTTLASDVTARAGQQWDRLETIFEQRVQTALGRLGVPVAADIAALQARIDELAAQVAALSKPARQAAAKSAAKPARAKPPARKLAVKRSLHKPSP